MTDRFQGKIAVVTGAGGGIGLAVAQDLARLGARVEALDVKAPPQNALTGDAGFIRLDLRDEAAVAATVAAIGARHGRIDHLVNCAGVCLFDRDGSALEAQSSVLDQTFDVNLYGMIRMVRATVPFMRAAGGGAMVHVASVVALRNMENIQSGGPADAYQMSKAAVVSLSRSLAMQLAPDNIRSNTVCPGSIATPMTAEIYAEAARADAMKGRTPAGRLGTPDDVAAAVSFLLSDRAGFITGVDLPVDGGLLAKL